MPHDAHAPHAHPHSHEHAHAGHTHEEAPHDHAAHASERRLMAALVITVIAMLIGGIGGWMVGSLALLADAGHMLADAGSLGLGLLAARQARHPADALNSYGHARRPILAAFVNGVLLLLTSAWIAFEGISRLINPQPVDGHSMILLAAVGMIANLLSYACLHGGDSEDLNRRGAAAHVLADLLGSAAALLAAYVIIRTGWLPADPLLSMFAASLVLRRGIIVSRESAHILLEGTPRGLNLAAIAHALPGQVTGLSSVHHLHAWSLSQNKKMMTLHAVPESGVAPGVLIARIRAALQGQGITHVTVQVEPEACGEGDCGKHEDVGPNFYS